MTPTPEERAGSRYVGPGVTVALAVAVFLAGYYAIFFRPEGSNVATWWPAAGLATSALLLNQPRAWAWVAPLLGGAVLAANLAGGQSLPVSLLFTAGNLGEAITVAVVFGALRGRPRLRNRADFGRLVAAAAAGGLVIGVIAAVIVSAYFSGPFLLTVVNIFNAHVAAVLLVVPAALALTDSTSTERDGKAGPWVGWIQTALLFGVIGAVFGPLSDLPFAFLQFPFLVWGALVLSFRVVAVQTLAAGVAISWLSTRVGGPFLAADASFQTIAILGQATLVTIALVALPTALLVRERHEALAAALDDRARAVATERTLVREQDFTASLLAATTSTAILATETSGLVTYANAGAQAMIGATEKELVGCPLADLFEGDASFADLVGSLVGSEDSVDRDRTLIARDGSSIRISLAVTPLQSRDGHATGYLAIGNDVTEREAAARALEEALATERESLQRITELDQSKTEFMSTVSHELRTPMTSILGFNQFLASGTAGEINDRQAELHRRIARSGQRLMGLIENILTISRVEAVGSSPNRDPVDVGEWVRGAVEAVDHVRWERELDFTVQVAADGVCVSGDADQLGRALINVLSNAVKFTPDGGSVQVAAWVEPGTSRGRTVIVTVTDTGVGIPEDDQQNIFERFYRAENAVADAIPGTGLGLAIVQKIMATHDGAVHLTSQQGQGTQVRLELPAAADANEVERAS